MVGRFTESRQDRRRAKVLLFWLRSSLVRSDAVGLHRFPFVFRFRIGGIESDAF